MAAWTINGYDPSTIGVVFEDAEGWRSSPLVRRARTDAPGRFGRISMGKEAEAEPRRLIITATQKAATVPDLNAYLQELKRRLYDGILGVTFVDAPDRVFYGSTEHVEVISIRPALTQAAHRLRITIECEDPKVYKATPTQVVFTSGRTELPLGTAISVPVFRISGPPASFTITYRNSRGAILTQMAFTLAPAPAYLDIDCANMEITDNAGARRVDAMEADAEFITFDPYDGAIDGSAMPTVEISPAPTLAVASYVETYL